MIIELIYIAFCLLLARYNKRRIAYDKKILHGINGLLHVVFWLAVMWLKNNWFPACVLPFLGRLFFDGGLNVMRHLPIDYVAKKPKSIVDKVEKAIFKMDGVTPKIIYLIIIIGLNILYYAR